MHGSPLCRCKQESQAPLPPVCIRVIEHASQWIGYYLIGYRRNEIMKNLEVNVLTSICNESCLSPAAEFTWLCLPLNIFQKRRNYPLGWLTKYQFNSLWFCHLVLWMERISSGNLPFVCPLTGHTKHCLLRCSSYSWPDVGLNRCGTWVSTLSSLLFVERKGNENSLTCWRGDGWEGLNSAVSLHAKLTSWGSSHPTLHPFAPPRKVWSPPGKVFLPQANSDSWNVTDALQHMELSQQQPVGTRR